MVKRDITLEVHAVTLYSGDSLKPTKANGILIGVDFVGEKIHLDRTNLAFCPDTVHATQPNISVLAGAHCLVQFKHANSVYGVKNDGLHGIVCNYTRLPPAYVALFESIKKGTTLEPLCMQIKPCDVELIKPFGLELSNILIEHLMHMDKENDPLLKKPEGVYFSF